MPFDAMYFDAGLDRRGTRCDKWDSLEQRTSPWIPLWVADMDFPSPPAATEALLRRAAHPTYGYTEVLDDDFAAAADFWTRRHGWCVPIGQMLLFPCVITAMKLAIRSMTQPGDKVLIFSPVYGHFADSVHETHRELVNVPLVSDADGRFSIDWAATERAMADGVRAVLLCNPHNPVSRRWSKEELTRLAALCDCFDAALISDEIHAEFMLTGDFVPVLPIRSRKTVSLCSASKTFNLAGLQQALMFCPDDDLRERIRTDMIEVGTKAGNVFALEGTRAAYQHGDAWLDGLLVYLKDNAAALNALVAELLPKAVLSPMEATYLGWLDLRAYGMDTAQLMEISKAEGVFCSSGTYFGQEGDGFLRINIACPRRQLIEGMQRLAKAVNGHQG